MKKLLFCIIVVLSCMLTAWGQVPAGIKYQTVIRDSEGNVLDDQNVALQIDIKHGSPGGQLCCSETFSTQTNQFGLVSLEIGSQDVSGFDTIDWANGPYYLDVILDGNAMGSSELLAVPYALYAENSGDAGPWIIEGNDIYYEDGDVGIGTGTINNSAILELSSTEKGFLPPRMTYDELNAISEPADGLLVFCTDCMFEELGALCMFMYGKWYTLNSSELVPPPGPCPGIPTIEYEGKTYNTVQIGSQCWLRENLDVGVQINGNLDQENNGIIEKYCYNDVEALCEIYGGLYQWEEIMKYSTAEGAQGICPDGWHIPTDAEWCTMASYIDPSVQCNAIGVSGTDACLKMKSTSGWYSGGNGTNESGFTSLPAGTRFIDHFENLGTGTDFWTSTLTQAPGAYYWVNYYSNAPIGRYNLDLDWRCGVSVRCIKDE